MEDLKKIENLFDHAREYVNVRVDEAKLGLAEKASAVIAQVIAMIVVNVFFLVSLLFGSIAGALALGRWWGSNWLGFLAVAGVYLLVGILIRASRERMIRLPVMNAIIRQLFKNDEDHEEN